MGEIYDEFDRDISGVQHKPDGALVLSGLFPVHDLSDLGVELPEGPYATVRRSWLVAGGWWLVAGGWRFWRSTTTPSSASGSVHGPTDW